MVPHGSTLPARLAWVACLSIPTHPALTQATIMAQVNVVGWQLVKSL
jgi:hypothetical protein